MNIALIGQAAFGEAVFAALRDAGEQIVAVSAPYQKERPDALWVAARAAGVPCFSTGKLKRPDVVQAYAATKPDLAVMAFVTHILPDAVLEAPVRGTIEYHPSLLPRHRGRSGMHWAIRRGDETTGVTIFWVDGGVDTGPVLLQKQAPLGPDDTVGSLYFDKLYPMGVEALVEAVRLVGEGAAPRVPQDESYATYEPPADDSNSGIEWSRPAHEVYDLIRGSDPQPGAHALWRGERVRIFDARLAHDPADAPPGTVVATGETLDIALAGAVLRVQRAQPAAGKKLPAAEFIATAGIGVGARFEDGVAAAP